MPVPIWSRAKKYLPSCHNYTDLSDNPGPWGDRIKLADGESIFGVYENNPGTLDKSILITSNGLYAFDAGGPQFLPYREMKRFDMADNIAEIKRKLEIVFRMEDGRVLHLPVVGQKGAQMDIMVFYTYLLGVSQTLNIIARKAGVLVDCDPRQTED